MAMPPGVAGNPPPESEAGYYRLAMDSLPDTVFVAELDGTLRWVCPNVTVLFGRTASTIVEHETVDSLFGDEFVSPSALSDGAELTNQPVTIRNDDGTTHDLLVTVKRIVDEAGEGGIHVDEGYADGRSTDIAEQSTDTDDNDDESASRDSAEELLLYACRDVTELQRLRHELDEATERITDGFFSIDGDAVVTYANTSFTRWVGENERDVVGESLGELVDTPDRTEGPFTHLQTVVESGESTTREWRDEAAGVWYEITAYPSETGVSVSMRDVTERVTERRKREASEAQFRALFEETLDAVVIADDDGTYLDVNPAATELYGLSRSELLGRTVADFAPSDFDFEAAWTAFLEEGALRGEFELLRPDGQRRITDFAARANVRPGIHLSVLRDITDRVERERQLERQRDELTHLDHLNRLVREVNKAIIDAETPDEVFTAVSDRLVAASVYQFAFVARERADEQFDVVTAAGLSASAAAQTLGELSREVTTVARRSTSVVTPTPVALQPVDVDLLGCFPLSYAGTLYGLLVVGANRSQEGATLVGGEQQVLDDLGTSVAKAIAAVTARRLLHVDEVVTLEFAVRDARDVFNQLSRQLDATVTVTGLVPMTDGRHTGYLTVTADDDRTWDAAVGTLVEALDAIDSCRLISTNESLQLEVQFTDQSPALVFETQGAHIRTLTATGGEGRLVVELPADANIRRLIDSATAEFPVTHLVRKFTERRSNRRAGEIGGGESPSSGESSRPLTDKQLAALRAASAGGYYEWPRRGSTAQELADALGIAPATYHQHLRAAERKLVEAFFGS